MASYSSAHYTLHQAIGSRRVVGRGFGCLSFFYSQKRVVEKDDRWKRDMESDNRDR